jgi:hypothetical protein
VKWRLQNAVLGSAIIVALVCLASCGIGGRVRQGKSEADATQRLRDIRGAETTFKERHSRFGAVAELVAEGLLAARSTDHANAAFRFEFSGDRNRYAVAAIPTKRDDRNEYVGWSFFLDESGVIRGAPYGKANAYRVAAKTDEPIPQQ